MNQWRKLLKKKMIIRNHGTTGLFFFFTVANNCKCKKQVISVFKIFTHVICFF